MEGIKRGIARVYVTPHLAKYVAKMSTDVVRDGPHDPELVYIDFDLCDIPIRIHIPDFYMEVTIDRGGIHIDHHPIEYLAPE